MKRVMTTSVVAGLVGALGFASVAAQEATAEEGAMEEAMMAPMSVNLSGSLRSGVVRTNDESNVSPDDDTSWDIGSNNGSRVRVTGSAELDGGLTAGYNLERGVGAAALGERFHNVWLQGAFGTVTLGRQAVPYWDATSFDGSYHLGGGPNDNGDKNSGIGFGTNLGGPFNVRAFAADNDSSGTAGEGVDVWELVGTLTAGPVTVNAGMRSAEQPEVAGVRPKDVDRFAIRLNGGVANITWMAGYESADNNQVCMKDMMPMQCDSERFGAHVAFGLGAGSVYTQYEDRDVDGGSMNDSSQWLIGYSHTLSDQVRISAEHAVQEMNPGMDTNMGREYDVTKTGVIMRIDF